MQSSFNGSTVGCSGASSVSAPRLLCTLGADSAAEVIEEFVGPSSGGDATHFSNTVAEIELAERAQLKHGQAPSPSFEVRRGQQQQPVHQQCLARLDSSRSLP